ncbi:MAG: type IV secretion system protein [Eubacteriaceae bacterium]|nr:type IV secretion system protein [Eubacteriaceae bacterium]
MKEGLVLLAELINLNIARFGVSETLQVPFEEGLPGVYAYVHDVLQIVTMPVAYVLLALFFLLELNRVAIRIEAAGASQMGAEAAIKTLFKTAFYKMFLESVPIVLKGVYALSAHVTTGISGVLAKHSSHEFAPVDAIEESVLEVAFGYQFWALAVIFLMMMFCLLASYFALFASKAIVTFRWIEIYIFYAIAPIPLAGMIEPEFAQTSKAFLKTFASKCFQGAVLFLVVSIFPAIFRAVLAESFLDNSVTTGVVTIAVYSVVLCYCVFSSNKWSRAIFGI